MPIILIAIGIALIVGLAVAFWWRLTAPGKRIRFGAFTLYYSPALTEDLAKRVAQYLMRQNFSDQAMDARLLRAGAIWQLQLICSGQPAESQITACEVLAASLSDDVFAGAAVEVQVCDAIFRPMSRIRHRGRFGRRIGINAAQLFYLEGVTDEDALRVATFLAGIGVFDDSPKIAQMNRSADGYEFRLSVKVDPRTPEMVEGSRRMSSDLSRLLRGSMLVVRFCDGPLGRTLRTMEPREAEYGTGAPEAPGGPVPDSDCVSGKLAEEGGPHGKEKKDS